jgi:hypothetical protein
MSQVAELSTALSLVLLAPLDEFLHTRQLPPALQSELTCLAVPSLTLSVGRLHLLLEFLCLLLHPREEFGITLRTTRGRYGEREQYGRAEYELSDTRSHAHLLSSASVAPIGCTSPLFSSEQVANRALLPAPFAAERRHAFHFEISLFP